MTTISNGLNITKDKRSSLINDKYNTLTKVFSEQLAIQKENESEDKVKSK